MATYSQMPFHQLCALMADERNGVPQPVLAWGTSMPRKDNHGQLYRDKKQQIGLQVGIPGKHYDKAQTLWKDNLKMQYRVHYPPMGMSLRDYRQFRYETALKAFEGVDSLLASVTRHILKELLDEITEPVLSVGSESETGTLRSPESLRPTG